MVTVYFHLPTRRLSPDGEWVAPWPGEERQRQHEHASPRALRGALPLSSGSQSSQSAEGGALYCRRGYYEERWQSGAAGVCAGKKYSGAAGQQSSYELKDFVGRESEGEKGKVLLIITLAFMGNICGV